MGVEGEAPAWGYKFEPYVELKILLKSKILKKKQNKILHVKINASSHPMKSGFQPVWLVNGPS